MNFVAFERKQQGTGASRRLRSTGRVPGIVYGGGEPALIELDHNALFFALKKESFHSTILEMQLNGTTQKVLLRDYQMHPWKPVVLHADFQRVDDTTRLRKKVPLHFVGEEASEAVKTDKCLVNHVMSDLEIECLASKLPEFITVDLSHLKKGDTVHVRDLKLDPGIKVIRHGRKDITVASVIEQRIEQEETVPEVAPVIAAPPVPAKKSKKDEKQNKR